MNSKIDIYIHTYIPRNSLTKKVKDLYNEYYRTLKKEIEEDLRIWRDLPCSWIGARFLFS